MAIVAPLATVIVLGINKRAFIQSATRIVFGVRLRDSDGLTWWTCFFRGKIFGNFRKDRLNGGQVARACFEEGASVEPGPFLDLYQWYAALKIHLVRNNVYSAIFDTVVLQNSIPEVEGFE